MILIKNKINVKKALIVFPIVIMMVGTTLIGAFAPVFSGENNQQAASPSAEQSMEDIISDDKVFKLLDIHENLPNYIDKDVVLEGYFISLDETSKVFGVEFPLGNGETSMVSLTYELADSDILKNVTETTLVKASGVITSFEEVHEDDEKGDHNHTIPKFNISNVEIIR